jgi:uncharacterized membrane protein
MLEQVLVILTVVAALGAGVIGGVFFAFSSFVMRALRRLPPENGIAAMQSINIVVINPSFLGVFLGTAAVCVAIAVGSVVHWHRPGAAYLLAGSVLYLIGTFVATMLGNVPLNNLLASITPADPDAAQKWDQYVTRWTAWNHLRTAASLCAMLCFILVLRR